MMSSLLGVAAAKVNSISQQVQSLNPVESLENALKTPSETPAPRSTPGGIPIPTVVPSTTVRTTANSNITNARGATEPARQSLTGNGISNHQIRETVTAPASRRAASAPATPAKYANTDLPDLSGLSDEERKMIMQVMERQNNEEATDQQIVTKQKEELERLEADVRRLQVESRSMGISEGAVCQICHRTKFADSGVGHRCHNCQLKTCVSCGSKQQQHNSIKMAWQCSLCKKKADLLAKTGQWAGSSNRPGSGLDHSETTTPVPPPAGAGVSSALSNGTLPQPSASSASASSHQGHHASSNPPHQQQQQTSNPMAANRNTSQPPVAASSRGGQQPPPRQSSDPHQRGGGPQHNPPPPSAAAEAPPPPPPRSPRLPMDPQQPAPRRSTAGGHLKPPPRRCPPPPGGTTLPPPRRSTDRRRVQGDVLDGECGGGGRGGGRDVEQHDSGYRSESNKTSSSRDSLDQRGHRSQGGGNRGGYSSRDGGGGYSGGGSPRQSHMQKMDSVCSDPSDYTTRYPAGSSSSARPQRRKGSRDRKADGGGGSLSSSDEEMHPRPRRGSTPDLTSCDGFESESIISERGRRGVEAGPG